MQTQHYFSKKQLSKNKPQKITYVCDQKSFHFLTDAGVFSKDHIDKGTELLIKAEAHGKKILDLGCGYGSVGIIIKKLNPDVEVLATDVNERALNLAKQNAKLNGVDLEVRESDAFCNIKESFDTILLNPPQHAGKKLCHFLIEGAKEHLKKNGSFLLVARHQKGGKDLAKKMEEVFGNIQVLEKKSGFRVYKSTI